MINGYSMCTAKEVEDLVRSLVQAQTTSAGVEVATHVAYPNGDLVRVNVLCDRQSVTISDLSFGSMYLAELGIKLNVQQQAKIRSEVANYGCEFSKGRVHKACARQQIADAVALVANASRSVADYGLEARRQYDADFRVTVIQRLREVVGNRLREREPVAGMSGRSYRMDGIILDRKEVNPLAFIEAFATRTTIGDRFMAFSDLKKEFVDVDMISIYDDAKTWQESDLNLMRQVSLVIPYSVSERGFANFA